MTAAEILHARAELLGRLPMVRWDRCVPGADGTLLVYGWVARDDGRADFALVSFLWPDEPLLHSLTTSSARWSARMTELLHGSDHDHVDCVRVADVFGDLLPAKPATVSGETGSGVCCNYCGREPRDGEPFTRDPDGDYLCPGCVRALSKPSPAGESAEPGEGDEVHSHDR